MMLNHASILVYKKQWLYFQYCAYFVHWYSQNNKKDLRKLLDYEHYMYGLTLIMYLHYHLFSFKNVIIVKIHMPYTISLVNHDHISWALKSSNNIELCFDVKDPSCQKYLANSLTVTSLSCSTVTSYLIRLQQVSSRMVRWSKSCLQSHVLLHGVWLMLVLYCCVLIYCDISIYCLWG